MDTYCYFITFIPAISFPLHYLFRGRFRQGIIIPNKIFQLQEYAIRFAIGYVLGNTLCIPYVQYLKSDSIIKNDNKRARFHAFAINRIFKDNMGKIQ